MAAIIGSAISPKIICKMKFDSNNIEVYNGRLLIPIPKGVSLEVLDKAKKEGKPLHVEIDLLKEKKRRSLSANNLCWLLCQQIAEALSTNGSVFTKEDVYRHTIREMFAPVTNVVKNEDVEDMKEAWTSRGLGWLCDDAGESTLYGQTRLNFYVGSSQFDTAKMSRLIDGLIQDANELGLDVMSERERETILSHWEHDRKKAS